MTKNPETKIKEALALIKSRRVWQDHTRWDDPVAKEQVILKVQKILEKK